MPENSTHKCRRYTANMAVQAVCSRALTISEPPLQSFFRRRRCSFFLQGCVRDATFKETRPGSIRRAVLSTDIESFRRVQTTRASGRQTYAILLDVVWDFGLMPSLQSAHRVHHSTETAVLRVMADILQALDRGDFTALAFLDLSAAFDTVDHATLLRRIELSYGIRGMALSWLRSYLSDWTQFVRSGSTSSRPAVLYYGVPQG